MLTASSPANWITGFLQQRSLQSPNGNPLFSYHITQIEYEQLGHVVTRFRPQTAFNSAKHRHWSACFVLWCAEWYRRDCSSQKWEWTPLWQQLGFEVDAPQRALIIPLGLEDFWKRPVRRYGSEHRNFLGSIFIEGGLPFKLISSRDSRFADAIRKVLNLFYQVDLFGVNLTEIIGKQLASLPVVFSEPESVDLIASVVKNLMSFSQLVDTENTETLPSVQLDQQSPHWRDNFPIPLDNETGKGLLDNWLVRASKASSAIKHHKDRLTCEHFFDKTNGRFTTQVRLPKKLSYEFDTTTLQSSYVDSGLMEGIKRIAEFGGSIAQIENGKVLVPPRRKLVNVPRKALQSSLFVDLSQSGVLIDMLEVNDSSILLNEAPLGFVEDDGRYKMVGQGSFSTKYPDLWILVPLGYDIEALSGAYICSSRIGLNGSNFNWLSVNGDIRFYTKGNRFRIKTNATSTSSGNLYITGDIIHSKTHPARVYKGIPEVRDSEGNTASQLGLTLYLGDKTIDSIEPYELYGSHFLSVKNRDHDTLLRRSIAVLPEDLLIETKSVSCTAEVRVESSRSQLISVSAADCDVTSRRLERGRLFLLSPKSDPPANFTLKIQANLMGDEICVTLPFPATGIYAFDYQGQPLNQNLTIDQLLGTEINLYSAKTYQEEVDIELVLKPKHRTSPRYISKVKVADRTLNISLYSFKEKIVQLLSLSRSLDAEVEIAVTGLATKKVFSIRKYKSKLSFDQVTGDIYITESKYTLDNPSKRPLAMLIGEPERAACELEQRDVGGISLGRYSATKTMQKTGPWLLVPSSEEPNLFRPTFYKGADYSSPESDSVKSIQTAVKCFKPSAGENIISKFMEEMRGDFSHPGWNYFIRLWENYSYLPLATFEAWKALVEDTRLLTLALFKFEMDEKLLRALDTEFSIQWELIPIDLWRASIDAFKSTLEQLGLPNKLIDTQLKRLLEKLISTTQSYLEPIFTCVIGQKASSSDFLADHIASLMQDPEKEQERFQIVNEIGFKRIASGGQLSEVEMFKVIDITFKQGLLRQHMDSEWPSLNTNLMNRSFLHKIIADHKFQESVINYPMFAAAVATGYASLDIEMLSPPVNFEIKRIKSFDNEWFSNIYTFGVGYYLDLLKGIIK